MTHSFGRIRRSFLCARTLVGLLLAAALTAAAQPSRYELHSIPSSLLGRQMYYNIYLPEGYDSTGDVLPAVYLFRGHEREWANPTEDGSRRGSIKTVADSLFASGRIGRMILVLPGLSAPATIPEFSYVTGELIRHIDTTYRTVPTRWHRGMDGFSYGGLSVLQLLYRSPASFATAGSYDGTFGAFDLTLLTTAPDSYWNVVRPMKFFTHCANTGGNNKTWVQLFLQILLGHGISDGFDVPDLAPAAMHNWYFADLHMAHSLPLHWAAFQHAPRSIGITLQGTPLTGSLSGSIPLQWTMSGPVPSTVLLQVSRNGGKDWRTLRRLPGSAASFSWNTTEMADGTRWRFRMLAAGDTAFGSWESSSDFTVNNPGNGAPDVQLRSPSAAIPVSGLYTIEWSAADADGDSLSVSLYYRAGTGAWIPLATDLANTGSFGWDTRSAPNASAVQFIIRCSDGHETTVDSSRLFGVQNQRSVLQAQAFRHVAGHADGWFEGRIADPSALKGHQYRIGFSDSVGGALRYWVRDLQTQTFVVTNGGPIDGGTEGPLFDGIRLVADGPAVPSPMADSCRWVKGSSTLRPRIALDQFSWLGSIVTGTPHPSDYRLTVTAQVSDTSGAYFGLDAVPVYFTVRNVTGGYPAEFMFLDLDGDQKVGMLDAVTILERNAGGGVEMGWSLFFDAVANPIPPAPGDVFELRVRKPFTVADQYEFQIPATSVTETGRALMPDDIVLMQNFPNPFNPVTTIAFHIPALSGSGGESGLSRTVSVRLTVFDMLGREVAVLAGGRMPAGTHTVTWDASSVPSGIYFVSLRSGPTVQTKKMVLMK